MRKKKWLRGVMAMAVAGSLLISAAPGTVRGRQDISRSAL